jgi:uncharacterized protein
MRGLLHSGMVVAVSCTVLIVGCRRSSTEPEEVDAKGKPLTPLCAAAKRGEVSAVKRLLGAGTDPNAADTEGVTALQYATSSGSIAVVEALLAKGANARARDRGGSTALHLAAVDRQIRIAEALLAAGADVNARTMENVTPLIASVGSPYSGSKMSLLLIRAGADVNIADSNGETALWIAVTDKPDEVIEELLKKGANPNVQARAPGFPGYTPLHMAAMNGSTKSVELLLQYGADPAIRNDEGATPLDITNVRFEEVRRILSSRSKDGH